MSTEEARIQQFLACYYLIFGYSGHMKKLDAILTQLPKEVADIIEAMRAKTVILENDKKLLRQENAILLANQEMLVKAHKELFEENEALKNKTKAK